jgi:PhnB protein
MHAAILIGGAWVFLVDDFPEYCGGKSQTPQSLGGTPVTIHRYVPDCDAAIERAQKAGATVQMPAADMFWGDRYGVVVDPFGHSWSFATHLRDLTPEEIAKGMEEAFAQAPA